MDIGIKPAADGSSWQMTDLLGRSMGRIVQEKERFTVESDGRSAALMKGMKARWFATLDETLAEIEKHTHGTCRLQSE
jgi:hypothetical protein